MSEDALRPEASLEKEDALGIETEVDLLQLDQAAHEQAGRHEQHERDRDLGDDEHAAQAYPAGTACRTARRFQCRQWIDPAGTERGRESEYERSED